MARFSLPVTTLDRAGVARMIAVGVLFVGVVDAVTTEATLALRGANELNPVIVGLRDRFGVAWLAPKMIGHGLVAWMMVRHPTAPMLAVGLALVGLLTAIGANNYALLLDAVGRHVRLIAEATLAQ